MATEVTNYYKLQLADRARLDVSKMVVVYSQGNGGSVSTLHYDIETAVVGDSVDGASYRTDFYVSFNDGGANSIPHGANIRIVTLINSADEEIMVREYSSPLAVIGSTPLTITLSLRF